MKNIPLFFLLTILSGCVSHAWVRSYNYTPYVGAQQNWPVVPGTFTDQCNGMPVFSDAATQPYEVIGLANIVGRHSLVTRRAVDEARYLGADAVILLSEHAVNGGSVMLFGNGVGTTINKMREENRYWYIRYTHPSIQSTRLEKK